MSHSSTLALTVGGGPTNFSVNYPVSPATMSSDMPTTTGYTVVSVPAGGDLQGAINAATCGTIIKVQAGAAFGPITLGTQACDANHWIIIQSSAVASLPLASPGQYSRVSPADAVNMPSIQTSAPNTSAISTDTSGNGSNYYRLIGMEVTLSPALDASVSYQLSGTGSAQTCCGFDSELVNLGVGATATSQEPSHIVVDRCYIHGSVATQLRRGVALNGNNLAVINSYISDVHQQYADTQAIATWGGTGPYKIVNNYLEAAGENFMSGGATPAVCTTTTCELPSDIEFRLNYVAKQLSWKSADPSYAGYPWSVKNLLELKFAQRVLIQGNLFYHDWPSGQTRAILFTPRCQWSSTSASCQVPNATVDDVEFAYNVVYDIDTGYELNGIDNNDQANTQRQHRAWIHDNYIGGITAGSGGGGIAHELLQSLLDTTVSHNTTFAQTTFFQIDPGSITPSPSDMETNLAVQNELAASGVYGLICNPGGKPGLYCLSGMASPYMYAGNVMFGSSTKASNYPSTNQTCQAQTCFPQDAATTGFANYAACTASTLASLNISGCALASTSPYKNQGTDGKDPGADIPGLLSKTACATTGANCH